MARQPILRPDGRIFAYELLYRSSANNAFDGEDPSVATARVIANSYLSIGMDRLVGNHRAFINFDRHMLVEGYARLLPERTLTVEILETVEPDDEVIEACRKIKDYGYSLALDDFVCANRYSRFLDVADVVKLDFRLNTAEELSPVARELLDRRLLLLAEKVETREQLGQAVAVGCKLIQGYYFSKPEVVSHRQIPAYKRNYLRVLRAANRSDPDLGEIEHTMKFEASLVHEFLRLVNSPVFCPRGELRSLRQALAYLGWVQVRKWVALVTLAGAAGNKPHELMVDLFIRGTFCEALSEPLGLTKRSSELFLLGMYSGLDALLDQPMSAVIAEIQVADDIRDALLGESPGIAPLNSLLSLAIGYERADWENVERHTAALKLEMATVAQVYEQSVEHANEAFALPGARLTDISHLPARPTGDIAGTRHVPGPPRSSERLLHAPHDLVNHPARRIVLNNLIPPPPERL